VVDEARLAREALDQAVPLLAYDNRIPGFRGARSTYNLGVLSDDAALVQLGLDQLDDAIEQNLLFNSFSYLGTVAAVTRPGDPLFTRAIEYLDAGIQSGCTPVTRSAQLPATGARASHNVQGLVRAVRDLYVKAGRLGEARTIYNLALNLPGIEGLPLQGSPHRAPGERRRARRPVGRRRSDQRPQTDRHRLRRLRLLPLPLRSRPAYCFTG
jgi:hypothetical protein